MRGKEAFAAGRGSAPALDAQVMDLLKGRQLGVTPEGEASTIEILKSFTDSWAKEHLRSIGLAHAPAEKASTRG